MLATYLYHDLSRNVIDPDTSVPLEWELQLFAQRRGQDLDVAFHVADSGRFPRAAGARHRVH